MRSFKSLWIVVVALTLFSCSMSAKPEKNEKEKSSAQAEVIALNKADFLLKVYNYEKNQTQWVYEGNKPAIVDFYADWCGPCKMMAPIVAQLAEEYDGKVKVGKCNIDDEDGLARMYRVMSIPTFKIFVDGKDVATIVGAVQKEQLVEELKKVSVS